MLQGLLLCPTALAAQVRLSPQSGAPLSTLQVSGSGFARDDVLDLFFDTADLGTVTADSRGVVAATLLTIPATAVPGRHWVTVKSRRHSSVAQVVVLVRSDWRHFQRDPQHTGHNPTENVLRPTNVGRLVLRWRYETGGRVLSSPTVADGLVYVGSRDGSLYALRADTGQLQWRQPLPEGTDSSPTVMYGRVYIASRLDTGRIFVLHARTGRPLWNVRTGNAGAINHSPTVVNRVAYFGSYERGLFALHAITGRQRWGWLLPSGLDVTMPAVAGNLVYAAAGDTLYAADIHSGRLRWRQETDGSIDITPTVGFGNVYIGDLDGWLYAFAAQTGARHWQAFTGGAIQSSPALANRSVYVGSDDGFLYAFAARTGAPRWNTRVAQRPGREVRSSPAVANGVVYVGSAVDWGTAGTLAAFDARTGRRLWTTEDLPHPPWGGSSSPAVVDGMVYWGSRDGFLYAYSLPPALIPRPPARPDPDGLIPAP
jgi:outer membrane protein assembly factor BamB